MEVKKNLTSFIKVFSYSYINKTMYCIYSMVSRKHFKVEDSIKHTRSISLPLCLVLPRLLETYPKFPEAEGKGVVVVVASG